MTSNANHVLETCIIDLIYGRQLRQNVMETISTSRLKTFLFLLEATLTRIWGTMMKTVQPALFSGYTSVSHSQGHPLAGLGCCSKGLSSYLRSGLITDHLNYVEWNVPLYSTSVLQLGVKLAPL